MKAPFIVIDGQDGSGKSTQVELLQKRLKNEGKVVVFTHEPGGTPLAEALRMVARSPEGMDADALTQFFIFWAARQSAINVLVKPNLQKNVPVISNRGDAATYAYQVETKGQGSLEYRELFWRIREIVLGDCVPTRYIILDTPAEIAHDCAAKDRDHTSAFDVAPVEFYARVRAGFHAFAKALPGKVLLIDGTRTPEAIHEEVYRIVSKECGWQ